MVAQLCDYKLQEEVNLVLFHQAFMTCLCLMNIVSSLVTIVGNLLVIPALWKSSSLTLSMKVLFLNLAVSDLSVGLFAQPMFVVITCLMLNTAQNGGHNFDFLCPITMTLFWFVLVLFASSSFFSVTAIALAFTIFRTYNAKTPYNHCNTFMDDKRNLRHDFHFIAQIQ